MIKVGIEEIFSLEYTIKPISALKQYWRYVKSFSCIGKPKGCSMLLYLDGCNAEYTLKNGEKLYCQSGNLIYVPKGSEYKLDLSDFENESSNTININFDTYTESGEYLILSDKIVILDTQGSKLKHLISDIDLYSEGAIKSPGLMKANMYRIFNKLSQNYSPSSQNSDQYELVKKGIEIMQDPNCNSLSIKEIAQKCNISEIYLRNLFVKYLGISPVKYRSDARVRRAKLLLEYENSSIAQIAEDVGLSDTSYFIKTFKARVGVTPSQYRRQEQGAF